MYAVAAVGKVKAAANMRCMRKGMDHSLSGERGRRGAFTQQRKEKGSAERRAGSIWGSWDNMRLSAYTSPPEPSYSLRCSSRTRL